jgi:CheY-like chemotaxis protein
MTPETLKRAFEPFFTTKEIGKGTGLGLASCHGVVHQHNGWIEVDSQVGAGTEFKIFLPTTTKRPVPEASSQSVEEVVGSETILFVEDQAILRRMVSKILTKHGYKVLTATDGVEAKQIWEAHQHDIQLLLSDVMMPNGYSGLDLARSFRTTHPSLKVILISGFSSTIREEIEAENIPFLAKPFTADDLCKLIEECLGEGE